MKNIYLLVGPSGAGKTTIARELDERFGLKEIWSYTERPPRYPGEPGHIYVTPEEFDALGNLSGYTLYNGYRYGVPEYVVDASDVYVIDPAGVRYMKEHYHGCKGVVVIGIEARDNAERMRQRGDTESMIAARLKTDFTEFSVLKDMADVLFKNDDLDRTVRAIYAYICVMEEEGQK